MGIIGGMNLDKLAALMVAAAFCVAGIVTPLALCYGVVIAMVHRQWIVAAFFAAFLYVLMVVVNAGRGRRE